MATQEREPRAYELMTVFIPDLADEDSQAEIEKIEGLVTAGGGTMTETLTASPWGRRRLAYTIRFNGVDYRDGIYTVFHFDMAPSALTEMEREMKLDTNLMRYLLVHDDPKAGEKFTGNEDGGEEGESGDAPATAEGGMAAGRATAVAAATATASEPADEVEATEETAEPTEEAPAVDTAEPTEEVPVEDTSESSESVSAEATTASATPDAAEAAPVEEAAAKDTVTNTAPSAADEAAAGEATDDETDKE